ncbi:SGM_3592 family protein [Streptomyces sp. NPDC002306]
MAEETPESAGRGPGGRSEDTWDDVVLDETFVRAAETAEPSARARMLAARWRARAPEPQPWRSDEPPAGWFFSKARRRRWRRR